MNSSSPLHHIFSARIAAVQSTLQPTEALLVSRPSHLFYLCGFSELTPHERECFLVITTDNSILFKSAFSLLAVPDIPNFSIQHLHKEFPSEMKKMFAQKKIRTLFYDAEFLSVAEFYLIQDQEQYRLLTLPTDVVMQQRLYKNAHEQALLHQANRLTVQAVDTVLAALQPGITEKQLSHQLERLQIDLGADGVTFPTIVAFGNHSAIPHHQPTDKKLEPEMVVLIDSGAKYQGYSADMTRTIWFGDQPSSLFLELQSTVIEAYHRTTAQLSTRDRTEPLTAQLLDATARQYIEKCGFGEKFIHTTGHGIGIDVHEPPSLNGRNNFELSAGVCITVEPGIYFPGEFGYRYENSLVLTEQGYEVLGMETEDSF